MPMTIKEQILVDLKNIGDPKLLYQILNFIKTLSKYTESSKGNVSDILKFAGILPDEEAKQMIKDIDEEFSHIEGDW